MNTFYAVYSTWINFMQRIRTSITAAVLEAYPGLSQISKKCAFQQKLLTFNRQLLLQRSQSRMFAALPDTLLNAPSSSTSEALFLYAGYLYKFYLFFSNHSLRRYSMQFFSSVFPRISACVWKNTRPKTFLPFLTSYCEN